ncbi:MAG: TetR/AcrR family transcriptional regulator [Methylobacter tundripaludum]|uniref:TetR family transcriptional regulator n=1 Tax=Methylobacter tundripaludum TaxID=173365 RepID=A0A2S6GVV0_9GAMM|nr:TetR/AcrR family transcriptional regulator [Methylobacter tundripaludum]MCK9638010.1 TetR/AcrR family transcriptional regulator [Methylobacter tundripaludum]PPK69344.1 TetR family transcriptional regulator [Methylobacter tundripaludum]
MDQEIEDIQTKSEVQDEILLAALQLFAGKGYFNTSLIDIKEAAGLEDVGTIYRHFKSKQIIAAQLRANILDSLNISIDDIRRKNEKPSEQLRSIVDLLFRLTDEAPDVMRFLLIVKTDEFLPEAKPLHEAAAFIKIIRIIEAGIKAGELRNITPQLGYAQFFGIIENILKLVLTGFFDKKADFYQSQAWLTAWNTIVKK